MKISNLLILIFMTALTSGCYGQANNNNKIMTAGTPKNNPLLCDPIEGICGTTSDAGSSSIDAQSIEKPIKIIYFSDPICSACWGVEPTLRKLKLEYGKDLEIEYRMGGLLPNWQAMGDRVNPEKLAAHSEQMSEQFQMPMNGEVWVKDPPQSSYPASIAFKAAQIQDETKAIHFLRRIREDLFVRSINISKWENIEAAALAVGLDTLKLKADYEKNAQKAFEEDLKLAQKMGVRGFPCFYITNSSGASEIVYGVKPYTEFENALSKIHTQVSKESYSRDWKSLFVRYNAMTTKEFAELSGLSFKEAENLLTELTDKKELTKLSTKTGDLWSIQS